MLADGTDYADKTLTRSYCGLLISVASATSAIKKESQMLAGVSDYAEVNY